MLPQINLNNYWRGHWPQHPVQFHLHGLPEDVIVKVVGDFVKEHQALERPVKNHAVCSLSLMTQTVNRMDGSNLIGSIADGAPWRPGHIKPGRVR